MGPGEQTGAGLELGAVEFGDDGLIPAVIQDSRTAEILMLAYMNEEALRQTLATGIVHFWSRSRSELWEKGATSGNRLHVVSLSADCDGDAVVVEAHPDGPACHTGARSCFAPAATADPQGFASLEPLWSVIQSRKTNRPAGSYTVTLIDGGPDATGRKLLEEAGEVLVAAKNHAAGEATDHRVAEEGADLLYHLLVLLAERSIPPAQVLGVLADRST